MNATRDEPGDGDSLARAADGHAGGHAGGHTGGDAGGDTGAGPGAPTRAALAVSRLAALREEAAAAYDEITAADGALRALAGKRVEAERSLRAAWHRYRAVASALEAHAKAKPGLRASLATRFSARRVWHERQALLAGAVRDYAAPVEAARQAVAAVQAEFAGAVQARADAVAALRRLTVECAAALDAIDRGDPAGEADG